MLIAGLVGGLPGVVNRFGARRVRAVATAPRGCRFAAPDGSRIAGNAWIDQ
jgi:hypothetical protein